MLRRLVIIAFAGVLTLSGGAAAAAPVTETTHQKGLVQTFVDVRPSCEDSELYEITTRSNSVEHVTAFDDGRIHVTFTETGKFTAEPLDAGLPSYRGSFTVWGGFNQNAQTSSGTFTFNVRGVGSDGSRLRNHLVDHFNERPDGSVNAFFRCN